MPELPEVETTRRGIAPHLIGKTIARVRIRDSRLRWPVPDQLVRVLRGQTVKQLQRRAKYLLLEVEAGTVIIHLGMSGSLRIVANTDPPGAYDHVEIVLTDGACLRMRDPRRFGCVLWWHGGNVLPHRLLRDLGPEPLSAEFNGDYLYRRSRQRSLSVKGFVMDSKVVAGVGNIYANEALYRSGIHPARRAGRISRARYSRLADSIRLTLSEAIRAGGTTLRDFVDGQGNPGYFRQCLDVYGRADEPCRGCGHLIRTRKLNQRSSFFCPVCQR